MGMILLVEDSKVNQLVGSKLLEKLGYCYEIVNNGVEAVSAFESGSYNAVLMDCEMPEMNGFEATAAIRRLEGHGGRTPIIAMTAATTEADRDRCVAAGMDDYLTKPIRPELVAAVLERWIRNEEPAAASVLASRQPLERFPGE